MLPLVTVLIVDDESDSRDLLAILLESRGATASTAGSVKEALQAFDSGPLDLLISDLRMPGESGFDLIRELRRREQERGTSRLPAVAVSAHATAGSGVTASRFSVLP